MLLIMVVGETEDGQGVQQQQNEHLPSSPNTPSAVKHDGKGYALPSTKKNEDRVYATVDLVQKKLSQRKKKETKTNSETTKSLSPPPASPSPPPPSPPPPIDPALLDDDIKSEPSVPPHLPQSEELVEPDKVEPPYAKVNKGKAKDTSQPSTTADTGDDVEPYAAVNIVVVGGTPGVQLTTDREYDTIDNVMSPPSNHAPVNVSLSELEGDYACVRSDATILPTTYGHHGPDPKTDHATAHHSTTAAAHGQTPNIEHTTTTLAEENTEL